jgi:signal transduction histidine kinase
MFWFAYSLLALGFYCGGVPLQWRGGFISWKHNLKHLELKFTQAAWLGLSTLAIGLTFAGLPARWRELAFDNLPDGIVWMMLALELVLATAFFLPSVLIAIRKPNNLLVLFTSLTLISLGATETGMTAAFISPTHNPGGQLWQPWVYLLRALAITCGLMLLYVFPDGKFIPGYTRWLALLWAGWNLAWLLQPSLPFNPNDGPTWRATPILSLLFGTAWFSSGLLAQGYRIVRVRDPITRQQTRWTAAGLSAAVLGGIISYGLLALTNAYPILTSQLRFYLYVLARGLSKTLFMSMLPLFLSLAVMRYRLFDIDSLIHRALVYGSLTCMIVASYVGSVLLFERLVGAGTGIWASLPATILAALAFQPARMHLQRAASRLVYGSRDEPYVTISGLGQRLEATLAPDEVLPTIVETVADALKLPYAAIYTLQGDDEIQAAQYPVDSLPPQRTVEWVSLPVIYSGDTIARLELAPRIPGESFTPADVRLLTDLGRAIGGAVYATRLTGQLQAARERLVVAREEERRRLRRDLHDDIGPALASLIYRLGSARNLFKENPGKAALLVDESVENVRDTIEEVRRLVDGLRPPDLEEMGLLAAIRHAGANLGEQLKVNFDTPSDLPDMPAAVETAVYRIVLEALANSLRHAHSRQAWVKIVIEDEKLQLDIRDDGRGLPMKPMNVNRTGMGLTNMRERAEELGGSFEIIDSQSGGVHLHVKIPLGARPRRAPAKSSQSQNME